MMGTIDKQAFLDKYKLQGIYSESHISWKAITDIADIYKNKHMADMDCVRQELEHLLSEHLQGNIHSVESRLKNPEHLVEKIIRKICIDDSEKYRQINTENYHNIVRDLIGIRILVLTKEEWEIVHDSLCSIFPMKQNNKSLPYMAEEPRAYIRYGDRDVFKNKIRTDYTNKGYRSQHYVVHFKNYYIEIQVRTISEEVFGEFDHRVRYPYRSNNKFLKRYTNTIAQITSMVDELLSTCLQMEGDMWDQCAEFFKNDHYETFEVSTRPSKIELVPSKADLPADATLLAVNKILRKGDS